MFAEFRLFNGNDLYLEKTSTGRLEKLGFNRKWIPICKNRFRRRSRPDYTSRRVGKIIVPIGPSPHINARNAYANMKILKKTVLLI